MPKTAGFRPWLFTDGRTREDKYLGTAEYDTIRQVKQFVNIPVIANGDIDCAEKAKMVMDFTAADAIMLGRIGSSGPGFSGRSTIFYHPVGFNRNQ